MKDFRTEKTVFAMTFFLVALYYGTGYYVGYNMSEIQKDPPCIKNFHSDEVSGFLSQFEQEFLENDQPYNPESDFAQAGYHSPRDLIMETIRRVNAEKQGEPIGVHVDGSGNHYIVPSWCYVGDVTFLGEPVLYRR